jgi:hypothetical protein
MKETSTAPAVVRATAPERPLAQVRGFLVASSVKWFIQTYGMETHRAVLRRLLPAQQAMFSRSVMSLGWYEFDAWNNLSEAARAELSARGEEVNDFYQKSAHEVGEGLMNALFKTILARMSPTGLIARLPMIYGKLFDQGTLGIEENQPGRALLRLDIPPEMHEYARRTLGAALERFLYMSGAREVSIAREERAGVFYYLCTYSHG